jgi:hypothetical protein
MLIFNQYISSKKCARSQASFLGEIAQDHNGSYKGNTDYNSSWKIKINIKIIIYSNKHILTFHAYFLYFNYCQMSLRKKKFVENSTVQTK